MFDSSKAVPLRGRILCVLLADTVTWYGVLTLLSKKGGGLVRQPSCHTVCVDQAEASASASSYAEGSRRWRVGIYSNLNAGAQGLLG